MLKYLTCTYQIYTDDTAPGMTPHEQREAIVYAWICPDGRKYIGAVSNGNDRSKRVERRNDRIAEALEKHPENTWKYELLARLPRSKATAYLHTIEQMYIDMYQTMDPRYGFNIRHADPARIIQ